MVLDRIGALLPGIPALGLAICVGASLMGYSSPTYGSESSEEASTAATTGSTASEEIAEVVKGNFELDDGVYRGTGVGYSGDVIADVTIADKTITAVDIVEESDTDEFFNLAKAGVIPEIIEQQSYEVDAVTGATYSSRGIKNAVRNAITGEVDTSERGDGLSDGDSSTGSGSSGAGNVGSVSEGVFEDGTYTGSAYGYSGTTKVRVTVQDHKITSIDILSYGDTTEYFNKAKAVISKMISGNTTNVDAVSGATYSSNGIINAVRNALGLSSGSSKSKSSGGNSGTGSSASTESPSISTVTEPSTYKDGTYAGEAEGDEGGFEGGLTKVSVTISGGKITAIDLVYNEDTAEYFDMAKSLVDTIISKQSTNVDAVSGATYSSRGIINAVRNALSKATATSESTNTGTSENSGTGSSENSGTNSTSSGTNTNSGSGSTSSSGGDTAEPSTELTGTYKDGTYTGSASCTDSEDELFDYTINTTITIENDKITSCTAEAVGIDSDSETYFEYATEGRTRRGVTYPSVTANIVSKQSTSVDVVSGATYSSNAIMQGAAAALAQAKQASGSTEVDRSALAEAISSAEAYAEKEETYTASTWEIYSYALEAAKIVYEASDVTQSDIDAQTTSLTNAIAGLEELADKTLLEAAISEAEEKIETLTESDYTQDSWQNLQTALEDAKSVGNDADASQNASDDAIEALSSALEGLVKADSQNQSSSTYTDGTYTGSATCTDGDGGDFNYMITTTITISGDKITNCTATAVGIDSDSERYFDWAVNGRTRSGKTYPSVTASIVSKQSTSVDAVSGATYSSNAIMSGAAEALAKAKGTSSGTSGSSRAATVNKSALARAISTAEVLEERVLGKGGSNYTPSSWEAFVEELAASKAVFASKSAAQSEIDAQTSALNNAMSALEELANKTLLEAAIREATEKMESLNESDYTRKSWENLQTAMEKAKSADEDENTTQTEANSVVDELSNALSSLVRAGEQDDDSGNQQGDGGDDQKGDGQEDQKVYTYWASTECTDGEDGDFDYFIKTTITIQGGKIIKVEAESEDIDEDSERYLGFAVNGRTRSGTTYASICDQIVEKQSTEDIDVVSGATYSSEAIIEGAKEALKLAGK